MWHKLCCSALISSINHLFNKKKRTKKKNDRRRVAIDIIKRKSEVITPQLSYRWQQFCKSQTSKLRGPNTNLLVSVWRYVADVVKLQSQVKLNWMPLWCLTLTHFFTYTLAHTYEWHQCHSLAHSVIYTVPPWLTYDVLCPPADRPFVK